MKGDFSRDTFDPIKHYSRVLMQQGRVQLDADANAQSSIVLHYLRSLAKDLIGPYAGPDLSFKIEPLPDANNKPVPYDFSIHAGHYYVDGILCENDPAEIPGTTVDTNNKEIVTLPIKMADGRALSKGDWVELVDDTPSSIRAQIDGVEEDKATHKYKLTLDRAVNLITPIRLRRLTTYQRQAAYPLTADQAREQLPNGGNFLVYLDVWERHVTCIEDDGIREAALDGPDTTTRAQVVWQVKAAQMESGDDCDSALKKRAVASNASLRAQVDPGQTSTDACIIPPKSLFRGAENQLYRVEIQHAGQAWDGTENKKSAAATFKWSRDNGSIVFPILELISGTDTTTVTLEHLGRDDRSTLKPGDWVEIVDDDYVLQERDRTTTAPLLKVKQIVRTGTQVILEGKPMAGVGENANKHRLLRRWDHREGDPAKNGLTLQYGAALVEEGKWLELEDGVQIWFGDGGDYRPGDYWLIPARTATGNIEWPVERDDDGNLVPSAVAPHGVEHHYAPLAIISVGGTGEVNWESECRCLLIKLCNRPTT